MDKMISLTARVDEQETNTVRILHADFMNLYKNAAGVFPNAYLSMSTFISDGNNSGEEFFDEGTLLRVSEAIMEYTGSEVETHEILTKLQNAGILFRERRP